MFQKAKIPREVIDILKFQHYLPFGVPVTTLRARVVELSKDEKVRLGLSTYDIGNRSSTDSTDYYVKLLKFGGNPTVLKVTVPPKTFSTYSAHYSTVLDSIRLMKAQVQRLYEAEALIK